MAERPVVTVVALRLEKTWYKNRGDLSSVVDRAKRCGIDKMPLVEAKRETSCW